LIFWGELKKLVLGELKKLKKLSLALLAEKLKTILPRIVFII